MSLKARLRISIVALVILVVSAVSLLNMSSLAEARLVDVVQRTAMAAQQVKMFLIQRVQDQAARREPRPASLEETKRLWTEIVRTDDELAAMLENTMANSRLIIEILVCGEDGEILAASNRSHLGGTLHRLPELAQWEKKNPWQKLIEVFSRRQDYEAVIALGVPDQPKPIFTIQVVVSSILLRDALLPQIYKITAIFLASLLVSSVLAVIVSNLILRPLARISQAIDRISRGEFGKDPTPADSEAKEFAAVRTKLNVLGEQFRGAREDAVRLRANIEQLLERLQEVVFLFDRDDHLVLAGREAEQLLGRARGEIVGRALTDLFPSSSTLGAIIRGAIDLRRPLRDHPVTLERGDLPPAHLLVSVEMLGGFPSHQRIGALITLRDAETRRQIQSQLDISARLAAISRLTGGVAHEIKNPLNAITVHLEILRAKLGEQGAAVGPEIETISREITRLDRVVKTFLDFARPIELRMQDLEMVGLVREIITLVEPASARQQIRVQLQAEPEAVFLRGDHDLLKQAVLNVVVNAVEAMEEGGRLEVQVRRVTDECLVTIADDGAGIPAGIQDKIFNLYFSTKGKGSGIGLAVTFRVVQLHGGTIDFVSEPGKGTTFRLRFPALQTKEPAPVLTS
mgnify:CR=1 FL=1